MNLNPGHLLLSESGVIRSMNAVAAGLLGVESSAWTGKKLTDLCAESRCELIGEGWAFLRATGMEDGQTLTGVARPDDETDDRPPLGWRIATLAGDEGFLLLLWKASADHETLSSYRDTFTHAIEGIYRTTLEGRYLAANPALAKMYGYESPAALIEALSDLNTQLYVQHDRRAEFVIQIRQQGYVSDFESEIYRADGSKIWISEFARTVKDGEGRPLYFEGSVIDITEKRRALTTLAASRERYRHLIESLDLVPWEGALEDRRFAYVGPQAEALLGWPVEEWMRDGFWASRIHPDDLGWVTVVQEETLAKGDRFEAEYRMIRADGKTVWVRDMMTVTNSKTSAETPLMGVMLDITRRRSTELDLVKNSYFLDQLVGAFPVIVYLYDVETMSCLYVSGQVNDVLGYTPEALSEMSPLFLLALGHPDETTGFVHHVDRTIGAAGEAVEREVRLRSKGGDWVWLRVRESVFGREGEGMSRQIVGVATDITARHSAWEELVNSEALFRSLVEDTDAIPFEYDLRSRRLTYVGPQVENWLGYPLHRWLQEDFWTQIVHLDDAGPPIGFKSAATEPISEGQELQSEGRLRTADGNWVWVKQVLRCSAAAHGRWQARGFLLDVTLRKKHELELESSRRLLRQHASRIQMAREEERINIARELHDELGQALTLLNLDVAWLQLQSGGTDNPNSTSPVAEKLAGMKQALSATTDLLRRILTDLRPPILDELGLGAAIEWQAEDFARRVAVRCEVDTADVECPDPIIATAAFRIFQEVLTNIARHARATTVRVVLRSVNHRLTLRVTDDGVGFAVAEPASRQSFGLLGMRERAMALGGELEVRAAQGKGTSVHVSLPLKSPEADSSAGC